MDNHAPSSRSAMARGSARAGLNDGLSTVHARTVRKKASRSSTTSEEHAAATRASSAAWVTGGAEGDAAQGRIAMFSARKNVAPGATRAKALRERTLGQKSVERPSSND